MDRSKWCSLVPYQQERCNEKYDVVEECSPVDAGPRYDPVDDHQKWSPVDTARDRCEIQPSMNELHVLGGRRASLKRKRLCADTHTTPGETKELLHSTQGRVDPSKNRLCAVVMWHAKSAQLDTLSPEQRTCSSGCSDFCQSNALIGTWLLSLSTGLRIRRDSRPPILAVDLGPRRHWMLCLGPGCDH